MVSLKQKAQSGFTIVELLIVIVIIGILAGLVVTQFINANQSARDSERKTDINSIANQLEAYYARAGGYPALAQLNTAAWRQGNSVSAGDSAKAFGDPQGTTTVLANGAAARVYSYIPSPAGCQTLTDDAGDPDDTATTPCEKYVLTAVLENVNDKQGTLVGAVRHYIKNDGK